MFDPSKLNLDLDENKDSSNNQENKKQEDSILDIQESPIQNTPKQEDIQEKKTNNTENDDVLVDLMIPKNDIDPLANISDNKIEEQKEETNITQTLDDNSIVNDVNLFDNKNDQKGQDSITKETVNSEEEIKAEEKQLPIQEKTLEEEIIKEQKVIYDINITELKDLFYLLVDKEYDFVTLEPNNDNVKIEFRKNKAVIDTKFIKYPIYSNILIKAKTTTKLKVDENQKTQEGFGEINIRNKNFQIITKTVPGDLGEKLFLKLKFQEKKVAKKAQKKMSTSQILTFLGTIAFIGLLIGGSFIGFIALNAKTIEDVKFFAGLGIDLNEINSFIDQIITIIFSILLLFETIFLIIFLFKFSLTKKEFKKKKIKYGILSTLFFIITFSTFSAWMVIDQKINSLPNWQEVALGEVQIFDNSKLTSDQFDKVGSQITDSSNLIGPIEIKFDLSYYAKNQETKGVDIKKYTWYFGNEDPIETPLPTIIRNFDTKGNHEIKLMITETDIQGDVIEKEVEGIPSINLSYVVDVEETVLNNGGKLVNFNASSLSELGKIEWYFLDNLDTPEWTGEEYIIGKPIFEETIVGMYIRRNDKESETLDKIFIIKGQDEINIEGEIDYVRDIINDLEFSFSVKNISNDVGSGYIEKFVWTIGDQEYTKQGDIDDPEKSSEITHTFETYGDKTVKVVLTDSSGETKTITEKINIPRTLKLSRGLSIYSDGDLIEDIEYNTSLHEYFINNLGIPNEMKLDARLVKADSTLYSLSDVSWDYNGDGDIDDTGRIGYHNINTEGNHNLVVKFSFVNKKIPTDIIEIEENLFIEAIRKEAIIDFEISKDSNYVPVTIGFDASRSQVKDANIAKFIWDYGDGVSEERDSIVPGHKYTESGDYTVTLTVVTDEGKKYSTTKDLILKPKPQSININASMKNAPTYQGIDFSSAGSEGQISSYFWDFGDGDNSTEANPTHYYEKEGEYEVKLRLDFSNKNTLEDTLKINIYE